MIQERSERSVSVKERGWLAPRKDTIKKINPEEEAARSLREILEMAFSDLNEVVRTGDNHLIIPVRRRVGNILRAWGWEQLEKFGNLPVEGDMMLQIKPGEEQIFFQRSLEDGGHYLLRLRHISPSGEKSEIRATKYKPQRGSAYFGPAEITSEGGGWNWRATIDPSNNSMITGIIRTETSSRCWQQQALGFSG